MHKAAAENTKCRNNARPDTLRNTARSNIQHIVAGGDVQQQRGDKKQVKVLKMKHLLLYFQKNTQDIFVFDRRHAQEFSIPSLGGTNISIYTKEEKTLFR